MISDISFCKQYGFLFLSFVSIEYNFWSKISDEYGSFRDDEIWSSYGKQQRELNFNHPSQISKIHILTSNLNRRVSANRQIYHQETSNSYLIMTFPFDATTCIWTVSHYKTRISSQKSWKKKTLEDEQRQQTDHRDNEKSSCIQSMRKRSVIGSKYFIFIVRRFHRWLQRIC